MTKYSLTGSQLKQYEAVIDVFQQCVIARLNYSSMPPELSGKVVEKQFLGLSLWGSSRHCEVECKYQKYSFSPDDWSCLSVGLIHAHSAIGVVCNYQSSRASRFLANGYLYDPTNLVCEQLKSWLCHLSGRDLSDASTVKEEIVCYINYLKRLEHSRIFPHSYIGLYYKRTMNGMLLSVVSLLQQSCDEIDMRIQRRSLTDIVANISDYTLHIIDLLIQYLFFILRNNKAPVAISRNEILKDLNADTTRARMTRSFKLLNCLSSSPAIKAANYEINNGYEELEEIFSVIDGFYIQYAPKLGKYVKSPAASRNNKLNKIIGGNLIPDRHPLRRWFSGVHSGIAAHFQKDEMLIRCFLRLHALTEKIAIFCLLCRDLKDVVEAIGSYRFSEKNACVLYSFYEIYKKLNKEIRSQLQAIYEKTSQHYKLLSKINYGNSHWCFNYMAADAIYDSLIHSLDSTADQMGQFIQAVEAGSTSHSDQRLHEKMQRVATVINQFGCFFQIDSTRQHHAAINAGQPTIALPSTL